MATVAPTPGTGLKVPSVVRFDKLATLGPTVIAGKLGDAPAEWLDAHRDTFFACSASAGRSCVNAGFRSGSGLCAPTEVGRKPFRATLVVVRPILEVRNQIIRAHGVASLLVANRMSDLEIRALMSPAPPERDSVIDMMPAYLNGTEADGALAVLRFEQLQHDLSHERLAPYRVYLTQNAR